MQKVLILFFINLFLLFSACRGPYTAVNFTPDGLQYATLISSYCSKWASGCHLYCRTDLHSRYDEYMSKKPPCDIKKSERKTPVCIDDAPPNLEDYEQNETQKQVQCINHITNST